MAQKLSTGWIIALIVIALFIAVPDFQSGVLGIFKSGPGTGGSSGGTSILEGKCLEHDAITMTIGPVQKRYSPSTSVGTIWDRVFINGVDKGLLQDSTTQTVSFGDEVEVYYAENDSTYYSAKVGFEVPCSAAFATAEMDTDADEHLLVAEVAPTVQVYNENNLLNTATNNQTVGADDAAVMEFKITYAGVGGWSPYGKNYITFKANSTFFDDLSLEGEGVEVADTSAYRSKTNSSADYDLYTFAIPGHDSKGAVKKTYILNLDSSSNVGAAATSRQTTIGVTFDDEDWYQHSKTGEMLFGQVDDAKADVGFELGTAGLYEVYIN